MNVQQTSAETSLLLTLEEISGLVSHSHHPHQTLDNIVQLIQHRFGTDVCSVYVHHLDCGELVLGATIGLKAESVGRVRMHLNEGLTGLVAENQAPVMVRDAFSHPRFKFFPEAGEDPYHSFLGVPLIEGGSLQGVLVVQTRETREFSQNEIRMLVAVGAQLAPLVSEARVIEQVLAATHVGPGQPVPTTGQTVFHGLPLSSGTGVGHAYQVNGFAEWKGWADKRSQEPEKEQERLRLAMEAAGKELIRLSRHISDLVGEDNGAILQGQLMIMQDSTINNDLIACMTAGIAAEGALLRTLDKYVEAFQKLENPFFQERVYDLKDVFRRILWYLQPGSVEERSKSEKLILVAHEASVMDLFSVDLERIVGVVVESGGPQSHAAILARSLGIPMVGQVPDILTRLQTGQLLSVDGSTGTIDTAPHGDLESGVAEGKARSKTEGRRLLPVWSGSPRLEANINLLCEVERALEQGSNGVGLYRSEFIFLARRTLPTEDEQVGVYRKLLQLLAGKPATIRTFDLRPDKAAHYAHLQWATAHPLDWRRILDSPPLQKLFKDQVRAILRAAVHGPTRILIPMVMRSEQLDFVVETLAQAKEELNREGLRFASAVPFGVAIEVAAATAMIPDWAEKVDFFALGTNDLIASALGLDREDPMGASPLDPLHPGILRLIHNVIDSAKKSNRPVTVCGEMGGDREGCLALIALGVSALSVAVPKLAEVRDILASAPAGLQAISTEILSSPDAGRVRAVLNSLKPSGPWAGRIPPL